MTARDTKRQNRAAQKIHCAEIHASEIFLPVPSTEGCIVVSNIRKQNIKTSTPFYRGTPVDDGIK